MAIQFARCEYVSRSNGRNACQKAAYNKRGAIKCERTSSLYYYAHKVGGAFHEVLLPEGVSDAFKDAVFLANEIERTETRKNSQLWKEFVLALPDDKEITSSDKIELTRRFADQYFVSKGVGVQLDIHKPDETDKNWHAHLLVTTRRFTKDGRHLGEKARDLDAIVRKGRVVEADLWGEIWRDLQNAYFEERGLDLRVDAIGVVAQDHLGPVRMRHHMNNAIERLDALKVANSQVFKDVDALLRAFAQTQSVFSIHDIRFFCQKHISDKTQREHMIQSLLEHPSLLSLYSQGSSQEIGLFTTRAIREEEERIVRLASNLRARTSFLLSQSKKQSFLETSSLSNEQKSCFLDGVQNDSNLKLIIGRAGTGKSYTLDHIRSFYENSGFRVIGSSFTNQVAQGLRDKGFNAKTLHKLLFDIKNNKDKLTSKTVLMIDEAGMIDNQLMGEVLRVASSAKAKVILVGDPTQLSSITRGGLFQILCERYGASHLSHVRRQDHLWQRAFSEYLSRQETEKATRLLKDHNAVSFHPTKEACLEAIVVQWSKDSLSKKEEPPLVLAQKNVDVNALNQALREVRQRRGELGDEEYKIQTVRGEESYSVGDHIRFTLSEAKWGIKTGEKGVLLKASLHQWSVQKSCGSVVTFDPSSYQGLRHHYAETTYSSQAQTIGRTLILHDKSDRAESSYVAHTRFKNSLKVFIPQDQCKDLDEFANQLARKGRHKSSLHFLTTDDLLKEREKDKKSPFSSLKKSWQSIQDHIFYDTRFYEYLPPFNNRAPVQKVSVLFRMGAPSQSALERRLILLQQNRFEREYGHKPSFEDLKRFEAKAFHGAKELLFLTPSKQDALSMKDVWAILRKASPQKEKEDVEKQKNLQEKSTQETSSSKVKSTAVLERESPPSVHTKQPQRLNFAHLEREL